MAEGKWKSDHDEDGSAWAKREGKPLVRPLGFGEYTDTVCGCLERLSPEIVVHRLTGDCDKDSLVAPLWSLEKGKVINAIRHKMKEIHQGKLMRSEDYTKLKKSYILFLCRKMPFEGKDLHRFTFRNVCGGSGT